MFTARLLASSADKRWDHSASVTAAEPATLHTHKPPALITRQAGSTAYLLPFDTDMWYSLVTDAAQHWSQRSQITFWIVFFFLLPPSQRIIYLTMAANATQGTEWSWRSLLLVFWDHIYLKWIVSVCTRAAKSMPVCASAVGGRAF